MFYKISIFLKRKRAKLRTAIAKRRVALKLGKEYIHTNAYWPDLENLKFPYGKADIFFKKKHIFTTHSFGELAAVANKEIAVFGAGPSVKQMDLSLVKENSAILVNGALFLADKLPYKPLLCILMDSDFLHTDTHLLRQLPPGTNLLLGAPFLANTLRKDKHLLDGHNIFVTNHIMEPYNKPLVRIKNLSEDICIKSRDNTTAFSLNPAYGLFDGGTVLTWALQMAFYLKAQTTYILGLDLGNYNQPHFYETKKTKNVSIGLLRDYERQILPFMTLATQVFAKNGLKIFNCSPITKLPYSIFPFSNHFLKKKSAR